MYFLISRFRNKYYNRAIFSIILYKKEFDFSFINLIILLLFNKSYLIKESKNLNYSITLFKTPFKKHEFNITILVLI